MATTARRSLGPYRSGRPLRGAVEQSRHPATAETLAPGTHGGQAAPEPGGDVHMGQALRGQQHDPGPPHHRLPGPRTGHDRAQLALLLAGQRQGRGSWVDHSCSYQTKRSSNTFMPVGGIPEEMRIRDSPRWNRGSMATLSAPPAHAWLAPQPRSGPPPRDDTQRSSRTASRPDPATPAERPSNSQTAAAAAVALRPIPALAIHAGGAVAASIAAHRAGLTGRARKAAGGARQAPRSTHCGCEPTPQTAAAHRTDTDALTTGRFGPRGAGRRVGAVGAPGAASLPCRPIKPECMRRTARPSDAAVQHHGRRRRGCTPWRGDH